MDEFQALAQLRSLPLRELEEVARETKIPRPTLIKVKYRTTKFPRLPTVKKLVAYFRKRSENEA